MAQQPQEPQRPRANNLAWMVPLGNLNNQFWHLQRETVRLQGLLHQAEAREAQHEATINTQQQRIHNLELQVQQLQDSNLQVINDHRLFVSQMIDAFEADRGNHLFTAEFFRGLLAGNVPDNADPALQARAAIIENPVQPVIEPGANHENREDERIDRDREQNERIRERNDRRDRIDRNERNERNEGNNEQNGINEDNEGRGL